MNGSMRASVPPVLERFGPALIVLAALAVWEAVAGAGLISATFFPPPAAIAVALAELLLNGDALVHASITLGRTLLGFTIGAGSGMLLGFAMGASPRLHALLDPLVAIAHSVPKIAVLPLILVIFGIDEASKVALGALGSFFPMLIATVAGVRNIAPTYFEVARSYGAGRLSMFSQVVLPGSLPLVLTGARLALNVALVLVIAGELLVAQRGLGQMMWFAWQTMRISQVYAWLVVTSAIGVALNWGLTVVATRTMPWRDADERIVG